MNRLFRRSDAVVASVLAVVSAALFFAVRGGSGSTGSTAIIYVNGSEYASYSLSSIDNSSPLLVEADGGYGRVTVEIGGDYAAIVSSECASQSCVETGRISEPGQSVICLPCRVSVVIGGNAKYDGMTG